SAAPQNPPAVASRPSRTARGPGPLWERLLDANGRSPVRARALNKVAILLFLVGLSTAMNAALHIHPPWRSLGPVSDAQDQNYYDGLHAMSEGAYGSAIAFFNQSLERHPSITVLNALSRAQRQLRQYDEAIANANRSLSMNLNVGAYFNRGAATV